MSEATAEHLADQLAGNDLAGMRALFAAEGLPAPRVVWAPMATEVEPAELRFLLATWHDLRGRDPAPAARALRPERLRPLLGYLMLLDVVDNGADFRYRLYGSKIAYRSGFDATGRLASEIAPSPAIGRFFVATYRAVLRRVEPLYTVHVPPARIEVMQWRRLILPLADTDGTIHRFLVGNMPGPWRSPQVID